MVQNRMNLWLTLIVTLPIAVIWNQTRTDSMHIRRFRSGDEIDIAHIHNEAFSDWIDILGAKYEYFYTTSLEVGTWISNGDSGFRSLWVAEIDGQPVGFIHCFLHSEKGAREIRVIRIVPNDWSMGQSRLAVRRGFRHQGIASALLKHIEDYAKEQGVELVVVVSFSDNRPAEQLLDKLGYTHEDFHYYPPFSEKEPIVHDTLYAHFNLSKPIPLIHERADLCIRYATVEDVRGLQALSKKSAVWVDSAIFTEKWIRDYILGLFGHVVILAELDGQIVGAMDYMENCCRIGIPGILPELRKQGIGYSLFHALLKNMQSRGLDEAIADSGLGRTDAIRMYKRFGFEIRRMQYSWFKHL